jgi:hypothetical protein
LASSLEIKPSFNQCIVTNCHRVDAESIPNLSAVTTMSRHSPGERRLRSRYIYAQDTRAEPRNSHQREFAVPVVSHDHLEYFAAQMFDNCLRARMPPDEVRQQAMFFSNHEQGCGSREPVFGETGQGHGSAYPYEFTEVRPVEIGYRTKERRPGGFQHTSTYSYTYTSFKPEKESRGRDGSHGRAPPQTSRRKPSANSSTQGCTGSEPEVCFYTVLGVARTASADEIKKSYRQLSMKWYPDRAVARHKQVATDMMAQINQAKDVLGDGKQRAYYDRSNVEL